MAGARQPIQLVMAKGKKNLTKQEISERLATEIAPCTDDLSAPKYLSAAEKKRFKKIANQLDKLGILGETDVETLARYITAQSQYEKISIEMRDLMKVRPDDQGENYLEKLHFWLEAQDTLAKLQNRYFTQAQTAATALGLTISARCKLIAPKVDDTPKVNKFKKFEVVRE